MSLFYAIIGTDVAGSLERRLAARPAHLARLTALRDEGRLLLAGPFPAIDSPDPGPAGFSGSLIVAEFPSQAMPGPGPTPTLISPPASMPESTCFRSKRSCRHEHGRDAAQPPG